MQINNNHYGTGRLSGLICIVGFIISLLSACTEMDESYKDFWKDGERVYPAPADSVEVHPGRNRIELKWLIFGDPNVSKAKIFWNYKSDSLEVPFQSTGKSDTVRAMLNGLEEGSYAFTIYTYDPKGNKSIPINTVGRVYGDKYLNSLLTRILKSAFYIGDSLVIEWGDPDGTSAGVKLIYEGLSGDSIYLNISPDAKTTVVKDFAFHPGSIFSYQTVFIPDPMAIDTFYTAEKTVRVKGPAIDLPRTGWTATASSWDQRYANRAPSSAIDGNLTTSWINQISPSVPYPHTLTIDMGTTTEGIEGISFYVAKRNETPKTVELLVSADGVEWTSMGMSPLQNATGFWQYLDFSESQAARYLRVVAIAPFGSTPNVVIYEVGAYTR